MINSIYNEPTFVDEVNEWYGDRYFFERISFFHKEVLEVTFYPEFHQFSYRYLSHSFKGFKIKQDISLDYKNENLPFWVKKVFYKFLN